MEGVDWPKDLVIIIIVKIFEKLEEPLMLQSYLKYPFAFLLETFPNNADYPTKYTIFSRDLF